MADWHRGKYKPRKTKRNSGDVLDIIIIIFMLPILLSALAITEGIKFIYRRFEK